MGNYRDPVKKSFMRKLLKVKQFNILCKKLKAHIYESKELYLFRGLPGSGKTEVALSLGIVHVEADHYFLDEEGRNYNYDSSKIKNAHEWCKSEVEEMMKISMRIAVSNTFTQDWEMEDYYKLAEKYGYKVYTLIVENRHGGINTHNVPEKTIEKMKNRFSVKL